MIKSTVSRTMWVREDTATATSKSQSGDGSTHAGVAAFHDLFRWPVDEAVLRGLVITRWDIDGFLR